MKLWQAVVVSVSVSLALISTALLAVNRMQPVSSKSPFCDCIKCDCVNCNCCCADKK